MKIDWKALGVFLAALIIIAMSSCVWTLDGEPFEPPADPLVCECVNDSLHLVTDPAFIQGWTGWDFIPDSVVWQVGHSPGTSAQDDIFGTDLLALLQEKYPNNQWEVFQNDSGAVVFCDGTNDKSWIYQNVVSRPYLLGVPMSAYLMGWNIQSMFTGGVLSFPQFKEALIKRQSTRGMNQRGSAFTLAQSMELWELLLQWCENRVADPDVFPPYRADFRWGLFDPEIVDRFKCRLWFTPINFQDDPSDPYARVRA